jgi:hypothetical protein
MGDFLVFRTLITPKIIQLIFWGGSLVTTLVGVGMMLFLWALFLEWPFLLPGAGIIVLGPVVLRIVCEALVALFRVHDNVAGPAR